MINRLKKISLGNWILIGMILGLIVGLFLNLTFKNEFIKNTLLMDNFFYLGGNLFIRLMKMLVVPLVFCSIVVGVTSIADIRKFASIGGKTIIIYIITTIIGVLIALGIAMIIKPGIGLNIAMVAKTSNATFNQTMPDTILSLIPENPLNALATGDMLPVIIFGLLIGFILVKTKEKTQTVNRFFEESNKIMIAMTGIVVKIAPIGVFCLMAETFGTLGFETLIPLTKLIASVLLGLAIQTFVIYPTLLIIFTKVNPIKFYRKFLSVMFFAFASLSSNATIPLNMNKLEDMGVSSDISSFTIPLGATINKDGTAIMQGIVALFVAQALGIDLGTSALLTILLTTLMASTTTPAVPLSGLVSLTMVFNSVGLPIGAIGLIVSIDHILDMFRTTVNVIGDAIGTILVAVNSKSFDFDVFNDKKEPKKTVSDII